MRNIKQIEDLQGKKVLVRVDFNLPISDGKVESIFRIQKALPTLNYLKEHGAKIIMITHLGKGGDSLSLVAEALHPYFKAKFIPKLFGPEVDEAINSMQNGEAILLENLRNDKGEQDKDPEFASKLAKYGDIYINEAFPVSHREDSSLILLPKLLPAYAGLQLEEEISHLSLAFTNPPHPFLFILGGAKFDTKMPLIKRYLETADHVFIGGALANDFFKKQGLEIGRSLVDEADYDIGDILKNPKIILPTDVVVDSAGKFVNKKVTEVTPDEVIVDVGEETLNNLASVIKDTKLVLWNGPLGKYEMGGAEGTKKILKLISDGTRETIIGGGDTVALISLLGIEKAFTFVSTGGGATLDFLADGTLPAIKALE